MNVDNYYQKQEIEEIRQKLNNLVIEKKENLLDPEVLKLSEYLDERIVQYSKIQKDNIIVNLQYLSGMHPTFYYYGENHLFANMVQYIAQGVANNEIVYISMMHALYNKLLNFLKSYGILEQSIKFCPVKELILSHKIDGLKGLKKKIDYFTMKELEKGYSGIRWIGQPTYAIQETSKEDFLNWEVDLTEALKDTKTSLICIYDYYDYMHEKKIIDDRVIEESFNTHSHLLKKFSLEDIMK